MMNLYFSVVIPSYNGISYLKKSINSVLNQTYKKFEIIIIDNNSNDYSAKIIEKNRNVFDIKIIEEDKNINSESIFPIWSMSKPITIVAMMILFERGKYNLEDTILRNNLKILKN